MDEVKRAETHDRLSYSMDANVSRDELRLVDNAVRQIDARGQATHPVINYWGVQGIGKTWLLLTILTQYAYHSRTPTQINKPTCALYYDFDQDGTADLPTLIRQLAHDTQKALDNDVDETCKKWLMSAQENGDKQLFLSAITQLSKLCTFILLLDTTENLDVPFLHQLETELIVSLIETNRVVVVVAGRSQTPQWSNPNVRRQLLPSDQSKLKPFTQSNTIELLERYQFHLLSDDFAQYIQWATVGNPLLVHRVAKRLYSELSELNQNELTTNPITSWHQFDDEIAVLLQQYLSELNEQIPERFGKFIQALFPLRYYRVVSLQEQLRVNNLAEATADQYMLLRILRQMAKEIPIVWWSNEHNGYVTDLIARRIIGLVMFFTDVEAYKKAQDEALKMYRKRASEFPPGSDSYIVEIIFHHLLLDQANGIMDRLTNLNEIETLIKELRFDRREILKKRIERDDELQALFTPACKKLFMTKIEPYFADIAKR